MLTYLLKSRMPKIKDSIKKCSDTKLEEIDKSKKEKKQKPIKKKKIKSFLKISYLNNGKRKSRES